MYFLILAINYNYNKDKRYTFFKIFDTVYISLKFEGWWLN